jgi:hypothetical protein
LAFVLSPAADSGYLTADVGTGTKIAEQGGRTLSKNDGEFNAANAISVAA